MSVARPRPLSGFPEFLPSQRAAEQRVVDSLRETFELHGYASLATRSVEPLDELLRKGETSNEVYVLRRLHAEGGDADSGVGLHFDLTVPLARYVRENAGRLQFPFRRYEISRCWRGERPQEGRYREFTQADVDVIGENELPADADAEVTVVMAEALSRLPLPPVELRVSNRRLVEGFYRGVGIADPAAVMASIDKLDKAGEAAVREMLGALGLDPAQTEQCLALARVRGSDAGFADEVLALGVRDPLLDAGLSDLTAALEAAAPASSERFAVVADLKIARGLDYYTGIVFEGFTAAHGTMSVCAGGRYDALASDGRTTYPGVGVSLGVTRLLAPLIGRGLLDTDRAVPSCVLVALPDEDARPACREIARQLRARGIATELAPRPDRYGRQLRYADRRGIPYVWFPGQPDQVKDIRSGDQTPADAMSWSPPAADLRPRLVTQEPS